MSGTPGPSEHEIVRTVGALLAAAQDGDTGRCLPLLEGDPPLAAAVAVRFAEVQAGAFSRPVLQAWLLRLAGAQEPR